MVTTWITIPKRLSPRSVRGAKERSEVSIEIAQKLVHIDNVPRGDRIAHGGCFELECRLFRFDKFLDGLFAQLAKGELGVLRIAIIEHRGDEVPGVAIGAFDEHGPHLRFTGYDVNVLGVELVVTDDASFHPVEHDLFDFDF
jgi:hypothetical protein